MFAIKQQACAASLYPNSAKQLLQFVRCTVQHEDWKKDTASSGNICADNVDGWVDPWPQIGMCSYLNDSTDINVFLAMKNKTELLSPPLTKGLLKTIIFLSQKMF